MIPIEVYIPPTVATTPTMIWQGNVWTVPPLNSVFWINPDQQGQPAQVFMIAGITMNVVANDPLALAPIRLTAIELDPHTMRPRETLVKPVTIQ